MDVLILGGTGAMGSHLCQILAGMGKIYVTSRKERQSVDGITYIKGNAHDLQFLQSLLAMNHWDAIVDFMSYKTAEFHTRAEMLLHSTNQYVYISSARVYADSITPITEDSPRLLDVCTDRNYLSSDEYALTKARQEDILRNSGMSNWTIIRPYITFSEIRFQLSPAEKEFWLYRALKGRTIVFSHDLAAKTTTLTYGYDVARAIAAVMGKPQALGEAFHITSNESCQWSEILDVYLNVIERKTGISPKVKMLDHWIPAIGGSLAQVTYDRLYNRRFDNSKISKFVDVTTFSQPLPALAECLSGFICQPNFNPINWKLEAQKDKLNEEWAKLSEIQGISQKTKYLLTRLGLKN